MGLKGSEPLEISFDELKTYMHANHSVYMDVDSSSYYLTDANDRYWRVQRTDILNEKGHYVDCSELVPMLSEFFALPFDEAGDTIQSVFDKAIFYASEK